MKRIALCLGVFVILLLLIISIIKFDNISTTTNEINQRISTPNNVEQPLLTQPDDAKNHNSAIQSRPSQISALLNTPTPAEIIPQTITINGLVVDEKNEAVSNADVSVEIYKKADLKKTEKRKSLDDGSFNFKLNDAQTYKLIVSHEGYIPSKYTGGFTDHNPRIILKRLGKFIGRVVDELEKPVQFANVVIKPVTGAARILLNLQTDQGGAFATEEILPPGEYEIAATQDEYHDVGEGSLKQEITHPVEKVTLRLLSEVFELQGRVIDYRTKNGVPGMKVVMQSWGYGGTYSGQVGEETSDDKGAFHFKNIPPGEYVVSGWKPADDSNPYRFADRCRSVVASMRHKSMNEIILYAAKSIEISGKVIDAKRKPVSGAKIICAEPGGGMDATTDKSGQFKLIFPPSELHKPSRYRLLASKKVDDKTRYSFSQWLVSENGDPIRNVVLTLEEGITLKGRVLSRQGAPIPDAALKIKNRYTSESSETKSDDAGAYEFLDIMPVSLIDNAYQNAYWLKANAENYSEALHFLNPSSDQQEMIRDIILDESLMIKGKVTDSENRPIKDVWVDASLPGQPGKSEMTDADGLYEFKNLPSGRYDLMFQYTKRPMRSGYLWGVQAGEENADIKLTFQPISLNVSLDIHEDVDRAAPISANIYRKMEDGSLAERNGVKVSLSSSSLSIMMWEPGIYHLRCYVPNCPMAGAWVVVEQDMEEDVIEITVPIGPPKPMNSITGIIQQMEGFTCRFIQSPLWNQAPVGPSGEFSLTDIPDGLVDLVLWVYDDQRGMPINVDALMNMRVEGGRTINIGEISVADFFHP